MSRLNCQIFRRRISGDENIRETKKTSPRRRLIRTSRQYRFASCRDPGLAAERGWPRRGGRCLADRRDLALRGTEPAPFHACPQPYAVRRICPRAWPNRSIIARLNAGCRRACGSTPNCHRYILPNRARITTITRNRSEHAARRVAPLRTVRPTRQRPNEQQNEDDDQNG